MDALLSWAASPKIDPAIAEEFRDRLVAALGNEMRGIFLDLGALDQRRDRRDAS